MLHMEFVTVVLALIVGVWWRAGVLAGAAATLHPD